MAGHTMIYTILDSITIDHAENSDFGEDSDADDCLPIDVTPIKSTRSISSKSDRNLRSTTCKKFSNSSVLDNTDDPDVCFSPLVPASLPLLVNDSYSTSEINTTTENQQNENITRSVPSKSGRNLQPVILRPVTLRPVTLRPKTCQMFLRSSEFNNTNENPDVGSLPPVPTSLPLPVNDLYLSLENNTTEN